LRGINYALRRGLTREIISVLARDGFGWYGAGAREEVES
jgi:hypothetical protein